jgi:hypothetical protein
LRFRKLGAPRIPPASNPVLWHHHSARSTVSRASRRNRIPPASHLTYLRRKERAGDQGPGRTSSSADGSTARARSSSDATSVNTSRRTWGSPARERRAPLTTLGVTGHGELLGVGSVAQLLPSPVTLSCSNAASTERPFFRPVCSTTAQAELGEQLLQTAQGIRRHAHRVRPSAPPAASA